MANTTQYRNSQEVISTLQMIRSGDDKYKDSPHTLPTDLRQSIDAKLVDLQALHQTVVALAGEAAQASNSENETLRNAREAIRRAKNFLKSRLPKRGKDPLLEGYLLSGRIPVRRSEVIRVLRAIKAGDEKYSGNGAKLPAELRTKIDSALSVLEMNAADIQRWRCPGSSAKLGYGR